jgi:hypothetical protein
MVKNMKRIDNKASAIKISNVLKSKIAEFNLVGERIWGNPQGVTEPIKTYELKNEHGAVWCCPIDWYEHNSTVNNRSGILVSLPVKSPSETIGQVVEIVIPYSYKKIFNTRSYIEDDKIELRNYGKFTIGRAGLKRSAFFDYIAKNVPHEIEIDEENEKYIKILELYNYDIDSKSFLDRVIEYAYLIKNFKEDYKVKSNLITTVISHAINTSCF